MEASDTSTGTEGVAEATEVATGVNSFDAPGQKERDEGSTRENGQPEEQGHTSAPPASAMTGVPLREDRLAGVEPGTVPLPPPAPSVAKTP